MNKLTAALFAAAMLAPAAGCRHTHLGDDTGVAYRDALQAQRESDAKPVAPMDADDAKKVMARHRGEGPRGTSKPSAPGAVLLQTSSSSSGGSGGSLYEGASGPIRLDAK